MKKIVGFSAIVAVTIIFIFLILTVRDGQFSFNWSLIRTFRLPAVITLVLGACSASFATYIIHLLTKNRIADLGTIGLSASNLLAFTIVFSLVSASTFLTLQTIVLPIIYFVISFSFMVLVFVLTFRFQKSASKVVLAGIVFSLTLSAITYMIIGNLPHHKSIFIIFKSFGSLNITADVYGSFTTLTATIAIILATVLFAFFNRKIKIIFSDVTKARVLGINVKMVRFVMITIISLAAAATFMTLGNVVFIGFVASNITYLFWKKAGFVQLLLSMITGVALISLVYFINTSWFAWNISFGIVTNVIAIPYLIVVILKRGQNAI